MAQLRGPERARYVTRMFARISRRYDLVNTVMSGGRHYAWRRMAVRMAMEGLSGPALDVAAGTGDFAFELARSPDVSSVIGLDFTRPMLEIAQRKGEQQKVSDRVSFSVGDAHALPFPDDSFACATVGFGIRNFIDLPASLREITRVVQPGGRVVSLEIFRHDGRGPLGRLVPLHFRYVTPWLGSLLAGDREAYTYLPESVDEFLVPDALTTAMEAAGLTAVRYKSLAMGAVAIHVGVKQ